MTGSANGGSARSYQELRESEELHSATLSSISDAVFLVDDEGKFTFICPNVDVLFGYIPDEVRAMSHIDRLLGKNLFDPAELLAKGEIRNIEREIVTKAGEKRTVLAHLKKVSIQNGTMLCACRDVTELKQAEKALAWTREELAHAARLTLVGELMASILHEVSQPLSSISINSAAGLRVLHDRDERAEFCELRDLLNEIHHGSEAAAAVIERLRKLVKKRPLTVRAVNLNDVVSEVLRIVRAEASQRRVQLHMELWPTLQPVQADQISLQQIVLNLVMNAIDAASQAEVGSGSVTVRTCQSGAGVQVAVSNNGSPIAPDARTKLFEPFFTTKTEGLGLGLSIARSIAEAHGGSIDVDEREGNGTTFRLALPI